ncbi:tig [Symbiodinium sp. CCMP2456]|nr:tig [Symbiodinium sp. CCMP2456]
MPAEADWGQREWFQAAEKRLFLYRVDVLGPYSHPVVKMPDILTEEEESLVSETLQHLRRTKRTLQPVEGRAAARGDVLSVDMQGYEMKEDGSRGKELDVGSAKGLELELGASTFSAEVERSLDGIAMGETRDVQVLQIPDAMLLFQHVKYILGHEQLLPELNDEFAKEIKREEQFKQAGTMEGIPEEEEGVAENFSLADLRAEIGREVRQVAQTQSNDVVDTQLRAHLRQTLQVTCHWADLGSEEATIEEELAIAARFLAEKEARTSKTPSWSVNLVESGAVEGLMQKIDMDDVERKTWSKQLGEPDEGETLKQVGKDPAREYQEMPEAVPFCWHSFEVTLIDEAQARLNELSCLCKDANREILRARIQDEALERQWILSLAGSSIGAEVLSWLRYQMEVVEAGES